MPGSPNRPHPSEDERAAARARLAARQAKGKPSAGYTTWSSGEDGSARPSRSSSRSSSRPSSRGSQTRRTVPGRPNSSMAPQAQQSTQNSPGVLSSLKTIVFSLFAAIASGLRRVADAARAHPKAAILVIVSILLIVAVCTVVSTCSARSSKENSQKERSEYQQQSERVEGEINLPPSLDPQIESKLVSMAETDTRVDFIIRHTTELGIDGTAVLVKLLKLTANEPEAVDFVRGFVDSYPQDAGEPYTERVHKMEPPALYQWDTRWGYTVYSSTTFALTGCCPTSLSMVYMGLTGNNDKTPYDMGLLANELGYMDQYNGTAGEFLTAAAPSLGLSARAIPVSADSLYAALRAGELVICNVTAGDFTTSSHYIVLVNCDKSGDSVTVHDPFSAVNTGKSWDMETISSQTIAAWGYTAS